MHKSRDFFVFHNKNDFLGDAHFIQNYSHARICCCNQLHILTIKFIVKRTTECFPKKEPQMNTFHVLKCMATYWLCQKYSFCYFTQCINQYAEEFNF